MNDPTPPSPRDIVLRDESNWTATAHEAIGPEAVLISASRFLPDSRVYATPDKVAKIRHLSTKHVYNHLDSEAEILGLIGRAATYDARGDWAICVQDRLDGTPFSAHLMEQQETKFGWRARLRVLRRLVPELRRLHRLGISHGDLRADNILVRPDSVSLVDFDLSRRHSPRAAAYRDWVGLGWGEGTPSPFWKLALLTLLPKVGTAARRVFAVVDHDRDQALSSEPDVAALDQAWALARGSAANARGKQLAYYSLTYRGHHLTGERAWYPRWEAIRTNVDLAGKSVLELGCNMGLLSTFATFAGARSAHGVDHDPDIVRAAQTVASGLQAPSTFEHLDLMGPDAWERRLVGRDIITALSVVHWLPDKDRVLAFLGQHEELIYEGHDTLEIETQRLRALGFQQINVIMLTERDRHVIHARK